MLTPETQDAFASQDHFDFTVLLTTLRGGYAGTTQTQRLYFNFPKKNDTLSSYADFLALLQDASQLSVIPPLKPGEPYRTSGFTSNPPPRYGDDNDSMSLRMPLASCYRLLQIRSPLHLLPS